MQQLKQHVMRGQQAGAPAFFPGGLTGPQALGCLAQAQPAVAQHFGAQPRVASHPSPLVTPASAMTPQQQGPPPPRPAEPLPAGAAPWLLLPSDNLATGGPVRVRAVPVSGVMPCSGLGLGSAAQAAPAVVPPPAAGPMVGPATLSVALMRAGGPAGAANEEPCPAGADTNPIDWQNLIDFL